MRANSMPHLAMRTAESLGEKSHLNMRPIVNELRGKRLVRDGFHEDEFGHNETGLGEPLGMGVPDETVPDKRAIAVHAEASHEATVQAGHAVDAQKEGDRGFVPNLGPDRLQTNVVLLD